MKLSKKILLGILIPSIVSVVVISYLLINRYMDKTIELETEKTFQEYYNINNSLKEYLSIDNETSTINDFTEYFNSKNIIVSYIQDSEQKYTNSKININNNELYNVSEYEYKSVITKIDNNYYLSISLNNNGNTIIYSKNINYIYKSRDQLIGICILTSFILIIIIIFVAYILAKTLTKPLNNINREVKKIANGDYDISLTEGKDELGILSSNINIMSKEIKTRNNELVSMVDSKQLFIDNLSHEMNTPLTSIYGYTELLEKANLDIEQQNKAIMYIKKETKRINEMYKKLLMLSYKENTDIEITNISIDKLYNDLYIELKSKLDEKNINLVFNKDIDNINCDEMLISIAVSNLIRNAINCSDNNTNIIINTYNKDNYSYISVKDNGIGISEENIKKIIEPFYRVDKVRSRSNGGAGLGLSIVKRITEIHNGELLIESKINEGSTFIIKLPK